MADDVLRRYAHLVCAMVHRADVDICDNIKVLIAAAGRPVPPVTNVHQQIVEPLRLCPFFERDVHRATHPAKELEQRSPLSRQHRARNHATPFLSHRRDRCCLMHSKRDILG